MSHACRNINSFWRVNGRIPVVLSPCRSWVTAQNRLPGCGGLGQLQPALEGDFDVAWSCASRLTLPRASAPATHGRSRLVHGMDPQTFQMVVCLRHCRIIRRHHIDHRHSPPGSAYAYHLLNRAPRIGEVMQRKTRDHQIKGGVRIGKCSASPCSNTTFVSPAAPPRAPPAPASHGQIKATTRLTWGRWHGSDDRSRRPHRAPQSGIASRADRPSTQILLVRER